MVYENLQTILDKKPRLCYVTYIPCHEGTSLGRTLFVDGVCGALPGGLTTQGLGPDTALPRGEGVRTRYADVPTPGLARRQD